jgi:small subunit ribosomal protein S2
VIADAAAEGLVARSGAKTDAAKAEAGSELGTEEPMPEWERELLQKNEAEKAPAQAEVQTEPSPAPAESAEEATAEVATEAAAETEAPAETATEAPATETQSS